jgi:TonB family protein
MHRCYRIRSSWPTRFRHGSVSDRAPGDASVTIARFALLPSHATPHVGRMLEELFDSAPPRGGWRRVAPWAGTTTALHAVAVGAILAGWVVLDTGPGETPPQLTYVGIAPVEEPPEPEAPEEEVVPEEPPEPEFTPEPPPEPDVEERPAGFEELEVPPEVAGIPDEIAKDSVRTQDFGGRGVAGGVGDGVVGAGRIARAASELRPSADRVYDDAFVSEPPVLLDPAGVAQRMADLYPDLLRRSQVGGTVVAEFIVLESGRVDPASIQILSADHPLLGAATRRALLSLRFRPGRVEWNGELQAVRVRSRMPFNWSVH